MTEAKPPRVGLCVGPDCRKHKKRIRRLESCLEGVCVWAHVECQDLCKGPVVVVARDEEQLLFNKVRGKQLRSDLITYLTDGTLSSALKKRRKKRKQKASSGGS